MPCPLSTKGTKFKIVIKQQRKASEHVILSRNGPKDSFGGSYGKGSFFAWQLFNILNAETARFARDQKKILKLPILSHRYQVQQDPYPKGIPSGQDDKSIVNMLKLNFLRNLRALCGFVLKLTFGN